MEIKQRDENMQTSTYILSAAERSQCTRSKGGTQSMIAKCTESKRFVLQKKDEKKRQQEIK